MVVVMMVLSSCPLIFSTGWGEGDDDDGYTSTHHSSVIRFRFSDSDSVGLKRYKGYGQCLKFCADI